MKKILTFIVFVAMALPAVAQVNGVVFRDFNGNQTRDSTNVHRKDVGIKDVTVTATNMSGAVATTTTNTYGAYSFPNAGITASGTPLRIEFSNLGAMDFSATASTSLSTSVQFVNGGAANLNYGVMYPEHYAPNANPSFVVPSYRYGQIGDNDGPVIVGHVYPYSSSNLDYTNYAGKSSVGATWAMASSILTNKLYTATVIKRTTSFGPSGIGAIYEIDPNAPLPNTNLWLDLNAAGVNVGTVTNRTDMSEDYDAMLKIGKAGIGGIDISPDGKIMYIVNLYQRTLVAINMTTKSVIGQYPLPTPTYTDDGIKRINTGGREFTDAQGRKWSAGNTYITSEFTSVTQFNGAINDARVNNNTLGTSDAFLYSTLVYAGNMTLEVPVTNGTYQVKLHASVVGGNGNGRNHDISAEGAIKLANYDTYAACGYDDPKAVAPSFTVTVADGLLNIDIQSQGGGVFALGGVEIIPTTAQSNTVDNFQPFAVKAYHDKVYVGGIITAETSQKIADMKAYIYQFNPQTTAFTNVLNYPLDYAKGFVWNVANLRRAPTGAESFYGVDTPITGWYPWITHTNFSNRILDLPVRSVHPQPMLVDIDFDIDGAMMMGFADRFGFMGGNAAKPVPSGSEVEQIMVGGDILRAAYNSGVYTLENNGTAGNLTSLGANNGQGPGGGEFYMGERYQGAHTENSLGGIALVPSKGEIINAQMDVATNNPSVGSGGIAYLSNQTGDLMRDGFLVYNNGTPGGYGKGLGLGDVELLLSTPPSEIGNRVWIDADRDGIQDAGEAGVDGVTMQLYEGATLVGTTTTANGGQWFFNNTNVNQNGATALKFNTAYTIRVANTQFPSGYELTTANIGGAGQPDVRDSDANLASGNAEIAYTTGSAGATDHSLDMGFALACTLTATITKANDLTCATPTALLTANSTPATGVTYVWSNAATTQTVTVNAAVTYTVTVAETATGCTTTANVTVANNIVVPACIPMTITKTK
jgi:hypothetical protein